MDEALQGGVFGVWDFSSKCFEDDADLDYSGAMGLALYCVENDDIGLKNFAVIAMDNRGCPIWHEMVWCGQFHGYKYLYEECVSLGQIMERSIDDYEIYT